MKKRENVSRYRWVILVTTVPVIVATEMMWLSLSPISSLAEKFYGVSSAAIAMVATSYMIMFIIFSIPASYVIDRFGYRVSLVIGAALTGVFGLTRGIFADSFTMVMISQFLIAAGQPFLLNITTKVAANWFPHEERATADGILTMAQYLGFAVPMILAPSIAADSGVPSALMTFAVIGVICAAVAIIFSKEKPAVPPPGPAYEQEDFSAATLKRLFSNKPYMMLMFICFISLGVFNTILTLIESILLPRGITSAQAGVIGAVFVVAGIIGAVILPIISDKIGRRMPFGLAAMSLLVILYLGLTFIPSFPILAADAALAGFSIMGVAPIFFQHGSEVAYPVQEGTSMGMILMFGQVSGALFVIIFEAIQAGTGSISIPMIIFIVLTAVQLPVLARMKESKMLLEKRKEQ